MISSQKFHEAVEYNIDALDAGKLMAKHITALVVCWQQQHGVNVDGKAGPNTIGSIERWIEENVGEEFIPPPSPLPQIEFYDRRKYAAQAHGPNHEWPVTDRPIEKVTGACAHQTACMLGERIERYDTVGAHFAVTRMGKVIWLHDFDRKVAAANGWNNGTVSIEFDGLYAGDETDPAGTTWDDPSTPSKEQPMKLTPEMIRSGKALLRWIKQQLGPQMNVIVAHRQSSGSRQNDPGSGIWKEIVLPMHVELSCSDGGVGFKLDDGRAIPATWDARCVGIKY